MGTSSPRTCHKEKTVKKQTAKLLAAVLTGAAAVVWTVACIFDFVYETPVFLMILRIVCALVWYLAFFVNLYRYRKIPKEN